MSELISTSSPRSGSNSDEGSDPRLRRRRAAHRGLGRWAEDQLPVYRLPFAEARHYRGARSRACDAPGTCRRSRSDEHWSSASTPPSIEIVRSNGSTSPFASLAAVTAVRRMHLGVVDRHADAADLQPVCAWRRAASVRAVQPASAIERYSYGLGPVPCATGLDRLVCQSGCVGPACTASWKGEAPVSVARTSGTAAPSGFRM